MACDVPHPDQADLHCEMKAGQTHAEHSAWTPNGSVFWANDGFVKHDTSAKADKTGTSQERLKALADRVLKAENQPPAQPLPPSPPPIGGETYEPELDGERLGAQLQRVLTLMSDGGWRTLDEISLETGDPPASVSARLRDFRKPEFGVRAVDRRRRGDPKDGLFEYRLVGHETSGPDEEPIFPPPTFVLQDFG